MADEAAERLLEKLRIFVVNELDEEERVLFALLLAPGVAKAYAADEVEGFGIVDWDLAALPEHLAAALRNGGLRVVGFEGQTNGP